MSKKLARRYRDVLVETCSMQATIDDDGDVIATNGRKTFIVFVPPDDAGFVHILFPRFRKLTADLDPEAVVTAMSAVTEAVKAAKIVIRGDWVSVSVESLAGDPDTPPSRELLARILPRMLRCAEAAAHQFTVQLADAQ